MKRIVMLMGLCALLYNTGCKSEKEEVKEGETNYLVTTPLKIDTSVAKEYIAQIRSVRNIELRAMEKGYLQNIYVDEGQHVKAGQTLFKIMPKVYEAEMEKAEAEANAAEIELQNTKSLADKNIVSKNELAMAEAKLKKANAELALSKVHLAFTDIKAPFDGIIDRLPLKLGSLVDEGELLTSLSDNSQMFAYFNVSEPEYLNYQAALTGSNAKTPVNLIMSNSQLFKHPGVVQTIEGEFNNETGNIAFRAIFPNPERLLRHGETGKVQMVVSLKDALVIPQKATYEIQDKKYVFLVDKNNVVKSKEIHVIAEMPDLFVLGDELKEGDKILLEGVQKVRDEDKITYKFQDPKQVISHLRLKAE
ncbi:efflux transporter periplasmic adaptor subunit [Chitinophaga caeni]|uniref:Efflux transporter periplasmic adaptor subunit n=1 Tax=Chitinophaga caeni TaxID=2029983 RepID=A0A291QY73_9BACT|nr:efflux RND transporter periplasmic adaptor subunit [Chitinophaga caeni]ATL48895.1 efflux transporter periplasmic adaptor subunit [Chitinophaga caeni]